MEKRELEEPSDVQLNTIIKNHVSNATLLFKLQSKFNDEIKTKLDTIQQNEPTIMMKLIEKINTNNILLSKIDKKIDDILFFGSVLFGLSILSLCIGSHKKFPMHVMLV